MLEFDVWNVNMDMVLVVLIVEVRKIQKVTVTFFLECPAESLNYFVLSACLLIAVILLSFMVIQGRNAKNKESVSVKILLNHVQMLALLSGIF